MSSLFVALHINTVYTSARALPKELVASRYTSSHNVSLISHQVRLKLRRPPGSRLGVASEIPGPIYGIQPLRPAFNVQNRLASVEFIKVAGFKLEDVNVVCILFTFLSIWLRG